MIVEKKFPQKTEHGLGITKAGKLQIPYKGVQSNFYEEDICRFGLPYAQVGDFAWVGSHTGLITPKNIGLVTRVYEILGHDLCVDIENLLGGEEGNWRSGAMPLTKEQVLDIIKFYGNKKEEFKASWLSRLEDG